MEPHEFLQTYQSKTDEELLLIARDVEGLVPDAAIALASELSRRGIQLRHFEPPVRDGERRHSKTGTCLTMATGSTGELLILTSRIYRAHFWKFMALMAPAVITSYYVVLYGNNLARSVGERLMEDLLLGGTPTRSKTATYVAMTMINVGGYFISWTASCMAYAAIASAVAQVCSGASPSVTQCLIDLRARIWPVLGASSLLFVVTLAVVALFTRLSFALVSIPSLRHYSPLSWILFAVWWMVLTFVIGRLALSVPAAISGCGVRQSMFRSDELTEGRWRLLALLITKFLVGGLAVNFLAFWLPSLFWQQVSSIAVQAMTVSFLVGLTVIEPVMFIGFSLLYESALQKSQSAPESSFATQSS